MKTSSLPNVVADPAQMQTCSSMVRRKALTAAVMVMLIACAEACRAGSATWSSTPGSGDWNAAANWNPATVPNGEGDSATFALSNQTNVSIHDDTEVSAIIFAPGASLFTIGHTSSSFWFILSGAGVVNNSGLQQNFVVGAADEFDVLQFEGTASAGVSTVYTTEPGGSQIASLGGSVWFFDTSSAGQASFINKGSGIAGGSYGSVTFFSGTSAANASFLNEGSAFPDSPGGATFFSGAFAGNATVTNNGGTTAGAGGGTVSFTASGGSAEQGTFINNGGTAAAAGGGTTTLFQDTSAANAIMIANGGENGGEGGSIVFRDFATGDDAQFKIFGNGTLSIQYAPFSVSIGSLEGDGIALIGSTTLIVGSNNLSTTFSGTFNGNGGFEKVGAGTLTLAGDSDFFVGQKTVSQGTLQVSHDGALGTGDVQVAAGATLRLQGGATNDYLSDSATLQLVDGSIVDLNFDGAADKIVGLTIDGVAQQAGEYGAPGTGAARELAQLTGTGTLLVMPPPAIQLLNISTRLQVGSGENVLIGGFIIEGDDPKPVILRGLGPSLANFGVSGALSDPTLELHDGSGNTIATNDDWRDGDTAAIEGTGLAPNDEREAAILQTLDAGAYTVILGGAGSATGIGLVEVYDLDQSIDSSLPNLSTRGQVLTGDDVLIGGAILGPDEAPGFVTLLIRALGPSLQNFGVNNALLDPVLTLYDANGTQITSDDDWKFGFQAQIEATGLAPTDDREAAILYYPGPGSFTAIVSGKDGATGVALVEIYNLH